MGIFRYRSTVLFFLVMIILSGCKKEVTQTPIVEYEVSTENNVEEPLDSEVKMFIYCEDDFPRQFFNSEGELTGMSVEVVEEIQARIGNTDKIEVVPWARGYNHLNNTPNTVLFSTARIEEREDLFNWVGPIDEIAYAFYGMEDTELVINSIEDAKKVGSIGVLPDDVRSIYLNGKGFTNLDFADDITQNFRKLMSGRIDLVPSSTDKVQLQNEIKEIGLSIDDLKEVYLYTKSELYIAISKGTSDEILEKWNSAFLEMKEDGTFEKIYLKYFPGRETPESTISE